MREIVEYEGRYLEARKNAVCTVRRLVSAAHGASEEN
jgi:hypothetical protein